MTEQQQATYAQCTGRSAPPAAPATEGWLVVGRRGGKSFILALCAVYLACFRDYRSFLAPGERATCMVIATDRKQARIIVRYVGALLRVPLLAQMIEREAADSFDLNNGVTIEVHTASFKSTRGYAIIAALCDEAASLAWGDQPALICEQVDWARAAGFKVICAGKGTRYHPSYHKSTPDTLWDILDQYLQIKDRNSINPKMFNSFIDGTKSGIEMTAVCNATGLLPQSDAGRGRLLRLGQAELSRERVKTTTVAASRARGERRRSKDVNPTSAHRVHSRPARGGRREERPISIRQQSAMGFRRAKQ